MSDVLTPGSVDELVEAVRSSPRVLAVGNGTKARLSEVDATKLSLTRLRGILEYEPSEFTFTALAGTPVRDLVNTLASRGQYLPFDPFLVEAGATLGGTAAAGLSGPGRFRFGGLRDFILGARFVDGAGRLLRLGGKVVKNAAGFDVPKFFIGGLGRFGVLVELTFKVFPARTASVTCRLRSTGVEDSTRLLAEIARSRFEADAIDIPPGDRGILVRLAGPASALELMAGDLLARWPGEKLPSDEAGAIWSRLREFGWAYPGGLLVKVPLTARALPESYQALSSLAGIRIHVSSGGSLAFLSLPGTQGSDELSERLSGLSLTGLTLHGNAPLWLNRRPDPQIAHSVKSALDPGNRFPGLDE